MTEEEKNFFDELKQFKEKTNKQKQRGLNDYNLLTTVLSEDDEVRLHSRVLHSLLDPNGSHYQGSLFLEKFLKIIGLDKGFEIENADVKREHLFIDLYITDGTKHIIIENKINANDQQSQIKNYIEKIMYPEEQKNVSISPEDIIVIYLSIDREEPSKYSLGKVNNSDEHFKLSTDSKRLDYQGLDGKLKDCSIEFKSVHYKKEILEWLESCQYEVQNITNLNEAIRQYKEVVEKILGTYTSKSAQIKDFLGEDNSNNLEIAFTIDKEPKNDDSKYEELVNEVIAHRNKALEIKYNQLSQSIVDAIKAKLLKETASKIYCSFALILKDGGDRYSSGHYIDFVLNNGIRIQLEYSYENDTDKNYFNLRKIKVYYCESCPDDVHIETYSHNFKCDNFYYLLTHQQDWKELAEKHANNTELIEKLKTNIDKYANCKGAKPLHEVCPDSV